MRMRSKILCAAMFLCAASVPAAAHHSFAMFDRDKTVTLTGTVKEFEWTNPHSWLHVTVMDTAGQPTEWAFEMGSPSMMTAHGWKANSIKVGDKITVMAHPLKDTVAHGGSEMSVTLANGKFLGSEAQVPPPKGALKGQTGSYY